MKKIEELREKARMAEANIEELKAQKSNAEDAVIENPKNSNAALKAAAATMQVSAAEKAFERALEEVDAEVKRLNSKEYKDAVKRLGELENHAAEIHEAGVVAAMKIFEQYDEWFETVKAHEALAIQTDIEHRNLFNISRSEAGLPTLKSLMDGWAAERRRVEYFKRKHGGQ